MYQMKEEDKTPEKQLNDVEIGNRPEKERNPEMDAIHTLPSNSLV